MICFVDWFYFYFVIRNSDWCFRTGVITNGKGWSTLWGGTGSIRISFILWGVVVSVNIRCFCFKVGQTGEDGNNRFNHVFCFRIVANSIIAFLLALLASKVTIVDNIGEVSSVTMSLAACHRKSSMFSSRKFIFLENMWQCYNCVHFAFSRKNICYIGSVQLIVK